LPNASGNILILDGKLPLSVAWKAQNVLVVQGSLGAKESKKLKSFNGIRIEYD
jgi:hypothetical protein